MIKSLIRKKLPASRLALSIGLGGSLLAANAVLAQTATDQSSANAPGGAEAERVVVTGSNIPTSEEVGAAPVDTVDQATRERTGQEDVLSVLTRSTPSISGGGNIGQATASTDSGATLGASQIAIHGLPTLVLLDGRRVASASAAAQGGVTGADVNLFPSDLIKRIEVLKDGASAIYGSDAIGGVVNVILDQDFTGFVFSGRYGFTEKGNVHDDREAGVVGLGDDKTKIVLGVQYTEQDPIFNRQRPFAVGAKLTYTVPGSIFDPTTGNPYKLSPGLNSPTDSNPAVPGLPVGVEGLAAGTYTAGAAQADGSRFTDITLDQNRLSFVGSFERQLVDKYLSAFADIIYASNYSQSYLNGQPLDNEEADGFGNYLTVPATAPYNPFRQTFDANSNGLVFDRFFNHPRVFRNDTTFFRVVAGIKGELLKDLTYEVALNTSKDETNYKNFNLLNSTTLNQALAGGFNADGTANAGGINATTGIVTPGGAYSMVAGHLQPALNLFAINNSPAATQGIFATDQRDLITKLTSVDGKMTYFLPFQLPAGQIGIEGGGEYRNEKLRAIFSPETFIGSVPGADINVSRDIISAQGEIQIPVIAPGMKIPGVYSFDVDAAYRFEHYEGVGDSNVPKVDFIYRPIQDIALRGSYSESFIAPTLYENFGPNTAGFSSQIALGGEAFTEQSQETSGSNPNLQSSRADTYTAGIVVSPHFVKGLTMNADFFNVDQRGIVGTLPDVTIINSVNNLGPASPYSGLVTNIATGAHVAAPGQLQGNLNRYLVTDNELNLGGSHVAGIDFGFNYAIDLKVAGTLTLNTQGVFYTQYSQEIATGQPFFNTVGFYLPGGGAAGNAVPTYHLTPSVEYKIGGFSASALGNYSPSLRDAVSTDLSTYKKERDGYLKKIRDYYTIDLLFSYEFSLKPADAPVPAPKEGKDGKGGGDSKAVATSHEEVKSMLFSKLIDGLKVSFGINNVTNARPPLISNSPENTNTDASLYDPYQRQYYFVVSKKF